ncbi:MAG: uroporphyrinogen-III C-methyltransferase [Dehalococcoidia bacterium]
MTDTAAGHVWIAGAGPGDPGLATVACVRALANADAVLYDALASPALLRETRPGCELVYVGKRAANHAMSQRKIEAEIVRRAKAGQRVVRLKGGDPFVFGRGGEEALACKAAGVAYTVIPGVTSAIAAAAYAGIPVTHRGLSAVLHVATGRRQDADMAEPDDGAAFRKPGTLVLLMGVEKLAGSLQAVMDEGWPANTPAACVQWGTTPNQRVVVATLATLADAVAKAGLGAPAVMVIGETAALAGELAWFEPGPLAGRRVVVTRARAQASELAERLAALGADVVEAPVLSVRHTHGELTTDERAGSRWDWIVFTSANGVEAFFQAIAGAGRDARALGTTKVAAVGGATAAALRARGVIADFEPSRATGATLADELPRVHGARILLPVSSVTDGRLKDGLKARGGLVEQVAVYETVAVPLEAESRDAVLAADAVTFASASAARFLRQALGEAAIPAGTRLIAMGPESAAATRAAFGRVDFEAAEPSLDALVAATVQALTWDS